MGDKPIWKSSPKGKVRILRPHEFDSLLDVIRKQHYKITLQALLHTGMRYVELQRMQEEKFKLGKNFDWFSREGRYIYLPKEASRKKRRTMKDRYVYLSSQGVVVVDYFLNLQEKLPRREVMDIYIKRWSERSGLGKEGMSVKTFRKTCESWLVAAYPHLIPLIVMSMGHTTTTAMIHYLNLPFTEEDLREIKVRMAGWGGVREKY